MLYRGPSEQLCRTNVHVVIWFQGLVFVCELGCRWLVASFSLSVWEPIRISRRTTASASLPITLMASPRQFTIPVTGKDVITYILKQQPVHLIAVACTQLLIILNHLDYRIFCSSINECAYSTPAEENCITDVLLMRTFQKGKTWKKETESKH